MAKSILDKAKICMNDGINITPRLNLGIIRIRKCRAIETNRAAAFDEMSQNIAAQRNSMREKNIEQINIILLKKVIIKAECRSKEKMKIKRLNANDMGVSLKYRGVVQWRHSSLQNCRLGSNPSSHGFDSCHPCQKLSSQEVYIN